MAQFKKILSIILTIVTFGYSQYVKRQKEIQKTVALYNGVAEIISTSSALIKGVNDKSISYGEALSSLDTNHLKNMLKDTYELYGVGKDIAEDLKAFRAAGRLKKND